MSRLFILISVFATLWCCPAYAQENRNNETVRTAQEKITELPTVCTMYSTGEYEIKEAPDEDSSTLGLSERNTSFDVVAQIGDWSEITTFEGVAYIRTEYLQKTPLLDYTEEDLEVMAHVLCGEAHNCPDQEQLYVGSVVLNRKADPRFPDTVKDVVFQSGQYACVRDGNYDREPTERNWKNAKWILEHGSVLPGNVVWQSGGKQGKGVYLKTKYHYYCY